MTIDEEYKGCRNCKYQPEPLTTCYWLRHQNEVHKICPMWKLKESECKKMVGDVTERTLGEVIVDYREKAEYFKTTTNVDYGLKLEQIAGWLEELSRSRVEELFRKTNEKAIRDKAIDDFVNECICYEHLAFEQEHIERIQAIAEQLKAGGNYE